MTARAEIARQLPEENAPLSETEHLCQRLTMLGTVLETKGQSEYAGIVGEAIDTIRRLSEGEAADYITMAADLERELAAAHAAVVAGFEAICVARPVSDTGDAAAIFLRGRKALAEAVAKS